MKLQNGTLKIKREFGEFDKVRFTFRYLGVNNIQRNLIEKKLLDFNLTINKMENNVYVITFPITKNIESERIKNLNDKMELSNSKYGISVSFTTCYDHAGFRLPEKIRDFYLIVGGEFDCSIIMILEKLSF